jgi:DNA-directed RNA polymerase specialized sigma24 family protein
VAESEAPDVPRPGGPPGGDARFEALVVEHGTLIRRAVGHVGGRRVQSFRDDVEQRVRIALWRRLQSEQPVEMTPSYLWKVAVRETVRAVQQEASRRTQPIDEGGSEPPAAPDGDPLGAVVREERLRLIEASVGELAAERQRAVRLHLQGFTVNEIMRLCSWPYQKARNLIARGIADLRASLIAKGIHA